MTPELASLRDRVREIARAELLQRFANVQRQAKLDGSLLTEADVVVQARLQAALAQAFPECDFLGEEMPRAEQEAQLASSARPLLCLDPLDGTTNFAGGLPYFAVSVAKLVAGQVEWGLVYDVVRDECFAAAHGQGAWLNGAPLRLTPATITLREAIAVVDFKRLTPPLAMALATQPPFTSQRNFGASSLDWCWLAAGRFQVYLHGGQKLWDYAAGSLILAEAGGVAATLSGEPVLVASVAPRSVAAAVNSSLFAEWRAWLDARAA
jgi:myo-inositol-1(or 4)-monophosphatase